MLRYLRHLLAKCSVFVRESFHTKLASFLTSTQNVMWQSKDPPSLFRGKELFKFKDNAKELAKWAEKEELCGKKAISWTNFCAALKLWPDLYKFLVKAKVGKDYLDEVEVFEKMPNHSMKLAKNCFYQREPILAVKKLLIYIF